MTGLAKGIAHVSFVGGGIVLPARNAYDRQVLADLVATQARKKGRVQVLLDRDRWMVYGPRDQKTAWHCVCCGRRAQAACFSSGAGEAAYCLRCALSDDIESGPFQELQDRQDRKVG
jgi:hypothetical protein